MKYARKTIIQPEVFFEAEKIFEYIKSNSPINADKFKKELLIQIEKTEAHPTANPPEIFLNRTRILYRYTIVMKSWKLIFKITNKLLVFLSIVHTSQHPHAIQKLRTNKYD
ncbi:MAG: type II toxin-antitoxin system RelE/ParE family toxin [Bacteroidota bacterium]|nr:type II toxin-antitoxin system RelE/ParE family toxin [Bacteroidota bacterium]